MEANGHPLTQESTRRQWIVPRVVLILACLLVIICGSVVLTDWLSPRQRNPVPSIDTQPATPMTPASIGPAAGTGKAGTP